MPWHVLDAYVVHSRPLMFEEVNRKKDKSCPIVYGALYGPRLGIVMGDPPVLHGCYFQRSFVFQRKAIWKQTCFVIKINVYLFTS